MGAATRRSIGLRIRKLAPADAKRHARGFLLEPADRTLCRGVPRTHRARLSARARIRSARRFQQGIAPAIGQRVQMRDAQLRRRRPGAAHRARTPRVPRPGRARLRGGADAGVRCLPGSCTAPGFAIRLPTSPSIVQSIPDREAASRARPSGRAYMSMKARVVSSGAIRINGRPAASISIARPIRGKVLPPVDLPEELGCRRREQRAVGENKARSAGAAICPRPAAACARTPRVAAAASPSTEIATDPAQAAPEVWSTHRRPLSPRAAANIATASSSSPAVPRSARRSHRSCVRQRFARPPPEQQREARQRRRQVDVASGRRHGQHASAGTELASAKRTGRISSAGARRAQPGAPRGRGDEQRPRPEIQRAAR